eukprot:3480322-Prymnesium_polylepis.1
MRTRVTELCYIRRKPLRIVRTCANPWRIRGELAGNLPLTCRRIPCSARTFREPVANLRELARITCANLRESANASRSLRECVTCPKRRTPVCTNALRMDENPSRIRANRVENFRESVANLRISAQNHGKFDANTRRSGHRRCHASRRACGTHTPHTTQSTHFPGRVSGAARAALTLSPAVRGSSHTDRLEYSM